MTAYAYIVCNKPNGVLYIGSTANILNRVEQHRSGEGSKFTGKYFVDRLVWLGEFPTLEEARDMERRLKPWKRQWKIDMVEKLNPDWRDLALEFNL